MSHQFVDKRGSEWSHSEPFCSWVEILNRIDISCLLSFYRFEFFLAFWAKRGHAFTVLGSFLHFRAKQRTCFYCFGFFLAFSGKAEDMLLPFSVLSCIFGQSRGPAFTVFGSFSHFRAKQRTCFYRFRFFLAFSGNAEDLLLPFSVLSRIFGQSSELFLPSWVQFRFLDKA
jgi:hypothetical protein